MPDPVPFVVTEALSEIYYKGLASQPRLIATTNQDPYKEPTGPEAYSILKELKRLGDHPLAKVWDRGLSADLRRDLNAMGVNWTSLDAFRIVEVGQSSNTAIVWIGVEHGALSFEEGSLVAVRCRALIDHYHIPDCHVEIRESRVVKHAGNRFLDPVDFLHPTFFAAREPYTATLGIPISTRHRPDIEGTAGFYLSAGGEDKSIYLVTARHVVLPVDKDNNEEYKYMNTSNAREDVVVLGTSGFEEKLTAIDDSIEDQEYAIQDAQERIKLGREGAEKDLREAEKKLEALRALRCEIATHWRTEEKRIIGELVWAPPITLSTAPDQYTLDLAVIKIDPGKLDASNYRGNTINIGDKYTRREFMKKVYLHPTSPTSFDFPINRMVKLQDRLPESDLTKPPMVDANGDSCLVVYKNGGKTGVTIGWANNVSSYTREYLANKHQESREWPVIPTDRGSGAFSAKGDSGSCVADAFGRIGGIITGGASNPNLPASADVTYVTPISFIMKALHETKHFAKAHLTPTLA